MAVSSRLTSALLTLTLMTSGIVLDATPASAAPRTLFLSEDFELRARLTETRLILTHVNLTNLPLNYRCRTEIAGDLYRSRGFLPPHLFQRHRYRTDASNLRGATATCTVTVDETWTVLWEGQFLEVLGKGVIDEPTGKPATVLIFQNITTQEIGYDCMWVWDDPPVSSSHDRVHQPPYTHDSISTDIDFSTVANMTCTERLRE
jgi:hypothetical protein